MKKESSNRFIEGLNAAQQAAVQHKDGPLLVLAGPGSGKTRVVTHRIAWLLNQGVQQRQIAALTFTNKAADEMKNRLSLLVPNHRVWIGTFHRFCAQILRTYASLTGLSQNFTIYDMDQSKLLLDSIVDKKEFPLGVDCSRIASAISWAKNNMVLPDNYQAKQGHILGQFVEKIYPEYQRALQASNAVDFDDLLLYIAILLKENPNVREQLDDRFRYILVDEYQDTNLIQYAIAKSLSINYPNLAVTGDPDQSIYGWRGANIRNILEFEKDFANAKVIRLEQNYRSSKSILAIASALIKNNKQRKEKELFTENAQGVLPRVMRCFNHQDEADCIAQEIAFEISQGKRRPQDYAIFYRMNALSRNLEHSLRRYGVPFQLVRGLEFFNRKEIKDVVSYLQFIYNPNDIIAFRRIINQPARGIGKVTQLRLEEFAHQNHCSLLEATQSVEKIPKIATRTQKAIKSFAELMQHLGEMSTEFDLEVLLSVLLKETNYLQLLQETDSEEDKQRLANVQELLSEMREFDKMFNEELKLQQDKPQLFSSSLSSMRNENRLERFLEQASLVSDVDAWDEETDRVSLMTLHASKGLEFPIVYLIALEDNILPHERSVNDKMQLEEERRLLFVGITRAKEEIRLSRTQFREYRGTYCSSILSRFLFELPNDQINAIESNRESQETLSTIDPTPNACESGLAFNHQSATPIPQPSEEKSPKSNEKRNDYIKITFEPEPELDPEYDDIHSESTEEAVFQYDDFSAAPTQSNPVTKKAGTSSSKRKKRLGNENKNDSPERVILYEEEFLQEIALKKKKSIPSKSVEISPSAITLATDLLSSQKQELSTSQPSSINLEMTIQVSDLIRHKKYGIGVVNQIQGPRGAKIATITFLSGVGTVETPLSDPDLSQIVSDKKASH
ncbi:MAG: UvrD-helicase domain-containing protein [Planctomycetia bacterium]|nr:UvrD-helicase domain-containing protein [Planctomycetia bacterium]